MVHDHEKYVLIRLIKILYTFSGHLLILLHYSYIISDNVSRRISRVLNTINQITILDF